MAVIDLTGLQFAACTPIPRLFGGVTTPPNGGAEEAIDRMGDRWAFQCVTRPYPAEATGRQWAAMLTRALKLGGAISIKQPSLVLPSYGSTVVASTTASGKSIPISGGTPGAVIKDGQWVTFVHSGQRYCDRVAADLTLNGSGAGTLTITNLLRAGLTSGDTVKLSTPEVEGLITGDFGEGWERSRLMQFQFTLSEAA